MVESVRRSVGNLSYEIIIVDGGSTDGSLDWLRKQQDINLIEHGELRGIGVSYTDGFKECEGEYVIPANDDVEFVDMSIMASVVYMQEHPTCGEGCFRQNRYTDDYTLEYIEAHDKSGMRLVVPYGQVCIIPRWLGERLGWWQDYKSYAGDTHLGCLVWESGYSCDPLPCSCINDFKFNDALRAKNSVPDGKAHPDSVMWKSRYPTGPVIGSKSISKEDSIVYPRYPRLLYAPIYEVDNVMQHQTKFGLRLALQDRFLVQEVDYVKNSDSIWTLADQFEPDIFLMQLQNCTFIDATDIAELRKYYPKAKFISWNGDYHPKIIMSNQYMRMMRQFDVASFSSANFVEPYRKFGINFQYWQVSYEPLGECPIMPEYDVLFLGNCYSQYRVALGTSLRLGKWHTGIYGANWPISIGTQGENLYDFASARGLYTGCKIAISDCQFPESVGYVSNRFFEATAAGAFVLQQKVPGMEELLGYKKGVHYAEWERLEDLPGRINYWLEHDKEREDIAITGSLFTLQNHSFRNRVDQFCNWL